MSANNEAVKGKEAALLPLFSGSPRRLVLGNLHSLTRIPIRCRGVGKQLDLRAS
jgi:hypothetical protein